MVTALVAYLLCDLRCAKDEESSVQCGDGLLIAGHPTSAKPQVFLQAIPIDIL
jgi:hypothetical protein